jgi:pyruvate/2-oxoacid:ferredoxin oxidoreductase alpha subunit
MSATSVSPPDLRTFEHPATRGTAQNPDVFFQASEACNPFYDRVPSTVQADMDKFAAITGRQYTCPNITHLIWSRIYIRC